MNNRFICVLNDYETVGLPRLNVVSNVPHSCERTTYIVQRFFNESQCKSR